MDERCDGRSNSFGNSNLQREFVISSWNIRGARPKLAEIAEELRRKKIDVCGIQETKTEGEFTERDYKFVCFEREQKQYGQGFAIRSDLKIVEQTRISDRIAKLVLRKRESWAQRKIGPIEHILHRTKTNRNQLTILNCYAPHMGLVTSNKEYAEKFYKELLDTWKSLKSKDCIILGDFNAKLGCKEFHGGPVGSHARGLRNLNGDYLYEFLTHTNYIAANTLFKHKACNITTWEGHIKDRKVFNQIDYILVPYNRKHSLIDSRSHQCFTVDTDHRLVTAKLIRKNDLKRNKIKKGSRRTTEDSTLIELKEKSHHQPENLTDLQESREVQERAKQGEQCH